MDKKFLNRFGIALVVAAGTISTADAQLDQKKMNVILILADDMGYDLSGVGTKGVSTPNIDRLMSQGISFTNAFSVCSSSGPSRSSILTGMYPHANGHWRNTHAPLLSAPDAAFEHSAKPLDTVGVHEWVKTMPEILADNGYFTAIMHKYHLSNPWKYQFSGRYSTKMTPEAYFNDINTIINTSGAKPFFIMANISLAHRPWTQTVEAYKGAVIDKSSIEVPVYLPDNDSIREELYRYYINIMAGDQIVGSVVKAIEDAGLQKNTMIIFTSDQGPGFHRAKASPYYAGSHVPLVIKGRNISKGATSSELVSLIDLMPTILEEIGISTATDQIQGESLVPILRDSQKELSNRNYIFTTHNAHGPGWGNFYPSRAIFDGHFYFINNLLPTKNYELPADLIQPGKPWFNLSYNAVVDNKEKFPIHYQKLVELLKNRPPYELYDMDSDPGQLTNLYGLPSFDNIIETLSLELSNWRTKTGDTEEVLESMIKSAKRN